MLGRVLERATRAAACFPKAHSVTRNTSRTTAKTARRAGALLQKLERVGVHPCREFFAKCRKRRRI